MTLTHKAKSALRYTYICSCCSIRFACQDDLQNHNCFLYSDFKNSKFACQQCKTYFEFRESLDKHENTCQNVKKSSSKNKLANKKISKNHYKKYSKTDFSKNNLCQNIINNKTNPFLSNETDNKFATPTKNDICQLAISLTKHQQQKSTEKPHKCHVCGCSFKYDFSLHAHLSSHTSSEVQAMEHLVQVVKSFEEGNEKIDTIEIGMDAVKYDDHQNFIKLLSTSVDF